MESEVTPVVEEEVVAVETMVVSVDVAQAITVEEEEEVVSEEEVATPCVLPCVVRVQSLNMPSGLASNSALTSASTSTTASTSTSTAASTSATFCDSAGPVVDSVSVSVPVSVVSSPATSWSATTRQVLEDVLVRPATKKQYTYHWEKFVAFCQEEGKSVFPIYTRVVADFLVALASISSSKTSPAMAKAAIRYYHGINCPGEQDTTYSRMCKENFFKRNSQISTYFF